jgi:hypothetical protein
MKSLTKNAVFFGLLMFVTFGGTELIRAQKATEEPLYQAIEPLQAMRWLYDNDELFDQLSGAARSLLELKFGRKKSEKFIQKQRRLQFPFSLPEEITSLTNVLVNDPSADSTNKDTQSETTIVLGSGSIIVAFNDSGSSLQGSHFTGWSRSVNGGSTFTDMGVLPNSTIGDAGDPVLSRDNTSGRIYLSTLGFTSMETVQCFRSDNNGASWTSPVACTPGFSGTGASQDKEWITVDNFAGSGHGNVYLGWRQFGGPNQGMKFVRSLDGGATWTPNQGLSISNSDQGAFVAVGADHAVYYIWYRSGSPRSIAVRKSTDQGVSFGSAVTITNLLTNGVNGDLGLGFRTNAFPHAVTNPVNSNCLYVVYNDKTSGGDRGNIYLSTSSNGGSSWSSPVQLNDDGTNRDQFMPTVAITPDGTRLFAVWYDRRLDASNVLIDRFGAVGQVNTGTCGVTFNQPNSRITDQSFPPAYGQDPAINPTYMGDYDQAVADSNSFYTTWGDNRSGNQFHEHQPDVRFASMGVSPCSPPDPPTLVSPANGATQQSVIPALDWQIVNGALNYDVQVDNDPAFGSVDRSIHRTTSTWNVLPALNTSTTYYWRVRATNNCGIGNWSSVRNFTTYASPNPQIFNDVPIGYWAKTQIEAVYNAGISESCGTNPLRFCPDAYTLRKVAARWLLKAKEGSGYIPPVCTTPTFADVPCSNPYAPWIEEFYRRGITAGCGVDPQGRPLFCPDNPVTRNQASVLVIRTLENSGYIAPAATGIFADVPRTDPFASWIEEFFRRGITSGCATSPPRFCPSDPITRAQMSVFLSSGFGVLQNCPSSSDSLCLQNRFRVRATWFNSQNNTTGINQTKTFSTESGFFYFTDPTNMEIGVKVLDARSINGHWWTFHGSLTSLQYDLTVTDTFASQSKTYIKPTSSFCGEADTGTFGAFPMELMDLKEDNVTSSDESQIDVPTAPSACTPSATSVCLLNNQFRVQVMRGGVAQPATGLTDKTGVFTFFSAGNAEVAVKVLDGRPVNGHYWVFFGSLTSLTDYQVVVTNTANNQVKTYTSPGPDCGLADTSAF